MGTEFRVTKGPTRASGTTAASVPYNVTKYMETKDLLRVTDFEKIEAQLRVFNLETNTTAVQVYLETSMEDESDDSAAWLQVVDFGAITSITSFWAHKVTQPPTPTSPTLLKNFRWKIVLTSASASQAVGATFDITGIARSG